MYTGLFLKAYVPIAPISVAMLPNMTSGKMAPPNRLPRIHPTNKPPMDDGVNTGRIVSASAILICISPKPIGANMTVKATYKAAMMAA